MICGKDREGRWVGGRQEGREEGEEGGREGKEGERLEWRKNVFNSTYLVASLAWSCQDCKGREKTHNTYIHT